MQNSKTGEPVRWIDERLGRSSICILVVDDQKEMRDYICELLCGAGYNATGVGGGDEAVALFRRERISLVLMDIFMPEKDGFETIMEMRLSFPATKVLAISGRTEHRGIDVLKWAQKLGAQRSLRKPFTPQELLDAVADVLDQPVTPALEGAATAAN